MKDKINVIEFITNLDEGGAESLVRDYALLLDENEINVITVVLWPPRKDSPYVKTLLEKGRKVLTIYPKKKMCKTYIGQKIWNRFIHDSYVKHKLLKIIKENNVTVIHSHLEVLYYVKLISRDIKGKVKLFFTCHSMPSFIFKKTRWRNEKTAAQYLVDNNNLKLIALHDNMRKELNEMFSTDKTLILPNGIDFSKYEGITETKTEIRETINVPYDAFVVGHIGRFTEAKNHDKLIDIFKDVVKRKSTAHLLMIGTGELQDKVETKLHDYGLDGKYTILHSRNDIPRLLKSMDVFVFPSKFEGLPVTLVEAQVSKLRCLISTNVTEECFFSEEAVPLDIKEPSSKWVDTMFDKTKNGKIHNDITSFDMKQVIKRLAKLYKS